MRLHGKKKRDILTKEVEMSQTGQSHPLRWVPFIAVPLAALGFGFAADQKEKTTPLQNQETEQWEILMTEEEVRILRHLPDEEAVRQFLIDFWKVRDPEPASEENEAKVEFETRVEYANRWFSRNHPYPGREAPKNRILDGWNTDRGRIYILLGPPDTVQRSSKTGESDFDPGHQRSLGDQMTNYDYEFWTYSRYQIGIYFKRQGSDFIMSGLDQHLVAVLEQAKLSYASYEYRQGLKNRFEFSASYKNGEFALEIPLKRITFDETAKARFKLLVTVYRDFRKVDSFERTLEIEPTESRIQKVKSVVLTVPYAPKEKGSYTFDLIMENLLAGKFSRHRVFLKKNL